MSLHKVFKFTERMNLDFSANATNLINHPSFALPDKVIGPGHVGRISRHQRGIPPNGAGREVPVLKSARR